MLSKAVFKRKVRLLVSGSTPLLSKALALAIIAFMVFRLYVNMESHSLGWADYAGAVIMFLSAIIILVDRSFSLNRAVGFYAIAIGGNRLCLSLSYIFNPNTPVFVFGMVLAGMSVNLCYTGYCFISGSTRKRESMILTVAGMFLANIVMIAFCIQFLGMSYQMILEDSPDTIAQLAMYLLLFMALGTEDIRNSSRDEQLNRAVAGMRHTMSYLKGTFIGPKAARIICAAFNDRSEWTDMDGHGPVESEFVCLLIHGKKDFSYMRFQKWKGEDPIYITITAQRGGSVIDAYRFKARSIVPAGGDPLTCGTITIYGDGVQYMVLRVKRRQAQ